MEIKTPGRGGNDCGSWGKIARENAYGGGEAINRPFDRIKKQGRRSGRGSILMPAIQGITMAKKMMKQFLGEKNDYLDKKIGETSGGAPTISREERRGRNGSWGSKAT